MSLHEFQFKTYRCEWQVQLCETDDQGWITKVYQAIPFPTRELANANLPEFADASAHGWGTSWTPKNAPHAYCKARVSYVEVLQK